jgi:hypothetical protein
VHREEGKKPPSLEDMRDANAGAAVGGQALDALVLERDAARARAQQPRDRIHQRGFAGAVRAEYGDDFARCNFELGAPQHLKIAVGDVEALDRKLRHATYAWPR